jgi:hypothetical protein
MHSVNSDSKTQSIGRIRFLENNAESLPGGAELAPYMKGKSPDAAGNISQAEETVPLTFSCNPNYRL